MGEGEGDRGWLGAGCRGAAEMGGPHHNAVECVRGVLDLVDSFAIVRLEANLPAVRPGALQPKTLLLLDMSTWCYGGFCNKCTPKRCLHIWVHF